MIWLILPVGLFLDLWKQKPFGATGLQIMLAVFFLNLVFRHGRKA